MASSSETGHVINLGNFKNLIDLVTGYANYNPGVLKLKIATMTTQWTDATTLENDYHTALEAAKQPEYDRADLFDELDNRVSRVQNYYTGTDATKREKEAAQNMMAEIREAE